MLFSSKSKHFLSTPKQCSKISSQHNLLNCSLLKNNPGFKFTQKYEKIPRFFIWSTPLAFMVSITTKKKVCLKFELQQTWKCSEGARGFKVAFEGLKMSDFPIIQIFVTNMFQFLWMFPSKIPVLYCVNIF